MVPFAPSRICCSIREAGQGVQTVPLSATPGRPRGDELVLHVPVPGDLSLV